MAAALPNGNLDSWQFSSGTAALRPGSDPVAFEVPVGDSLSCWPCIDLLHFFHGWLLLCMTSSGSTLWLSFLPRLQDLHSSTWAQSSPWAKRVAEKGWNMMSRGLSLFSHLPGTKTINWLLRFLFITPSPTTGLETCVWELKFVCNLLGIFILLEVKSINLFKP